MLRIITLDGLTFAGKTHEELVMGLRNRAWFGEKDLERYMEAVSRRARQWNGSRVRTGSAGDFLTDLKKAHLVAVYRMN